MALTSTLREEFIVGGKYRLMRKIGSGSFGDIYLGINVSNGEVRASVNYRNSTLGRTGANSRPVQPEIHLCFHCANGRNSKVCLHTR